MNSIQTSAKALYSAPRLTVHGNVETITRGGGNGHYSHGNGNGYGHCKNAGNPGHPEDPAECALS